MEKDMSNPVACQSLEDVRARINAIDQKIVGLVAERGRYVAQAARFKKTSDEVKAPQRVEQVIAKVRALSVEAGADPNVIEAAYRAMIAAFIQAELTEYAAISEKTLSIANKSNQAGRPT